MDPKVIHAISHTHWDFEWYFTRHEAFIQFAYHMDEVLVALEKKTIKYYLVDGQMSIIDDYVSAFPDKKSQIRKFVKAGRLFIGPWYTQTDELIISGESIVRNLNLGIEIADELGGPMMVGYLPDSFGQNKDMPKIYNGLGIKYSLFWRGVPVEKAKYTEFIWIAEDRSQVLVENIKNGYYAGIPIIESDQSVDDAKEYIQELTRDSATVNTAVPIGGDQRYVDMNLEQKLTELNEKLKGTGKTVVQSNYPTLFESIEKEQSQLEAVQGELVDPSVSKIHRSIYSSRYDQKYLNDKLERRMLLELEPLMTLADAYGIPYHKEVLDKIWALMVRNHAHDSAGGCNSDKTNQDIVNRLVEADQLSYTAIDYLARKLSISIPGAQENDLIMFNPLPYHREKVMTVRVSVPTVGVCLMDNGFEVPYDLLHTERVYSGSIQRREEDNDPSQYYYVHTLRIKIRLTPMNFKKLTIVPMDKARQKLNVQDLRGISNDAYSLVIEEGKIVLSDHLSGKIYRDILNFEDGGDEGDTYDYSPAYKDNVYNLSLEGSLVSVVKGEESETMTISGIWLLPSDLTHRASDDRDGKLGYQLKIVLPSGSREVEFKLKVNNQIKDHRLRAKLNVELPSKVVYGDSQFGTIKRPVVDPHEKDWRQLEYHEEPSTLYAMLHYVNLHNAVNSATVMTKGIKEHQIIGDHFDTIALTLYRSVGFLGRPNLIRRPGKASGNEFKYIPTPDSQLLGELTFKFALRFDESYNPAGLMRAYQNYAEHVTYYQNQSLNLFTSTLQYFVMNRAQLSERKTPVLNVSDDVVISSLHMTPDGSGTVIRIYNPLLFQALNTATITLASEASFTEMNLRDQPVGAMEMGNKIECGTMLPGQIKTFGIY